jgi:hypothetical protein
MPQGMVCPPFPQQQMQANQVMLPQVDIAEFDAAENKREFVGNAIYSSIEQVMPQQAGKITGMLLDENVVNFKTLLTNQQYYNEKVNEAYQLLVGHSGQPAPQ